MTLKEARETLGTVERLVKETLQREGVECLEEIEITHDKEPDAFFYADTYKRLLSDLQAVYDALEAKKKPVKRSGTLHQGENGRYCIGDTELTCGYAVEVLIYDDFQEAEKWHAGHIEAENGRYFVTGYSGELEGLKARCRW